MRHLRWPSTGGIMRHLRWPSTGGIMRHLRWPSTGGIMRHLRWPSILRSPVGRLLILCGLSLCAIVQYIHILRGHTRPAYYDYATGGSGISRTMIYTHSNESFRSADKISFSGGKLKSTESSPPSPPNQSPTRNVGQWDTYDYIDNGSLFGDNHYTVVKQSEVMEMIRASNDADRNLVSKNMWYKSGTNGMKWNHPRRTLNRTKPYLPPEVMADTEVSYNVSSSTLCPAVPPGLVDLIPIFMDSPPLEDTAMRHPELQPGGWWTPPNCTARHRMALIVPYRDRERHLRTFLAHLHPFLQKQQIQYAIYIVEQTELSRFNRAMLFNIGFTEANKLHEWDCFIFHDVDLLPENDRNLYTCPRMPRHMSVGVDKFGYRLPYKDIFGGVSALRKEHFATVNGFANTYFGWGAEDDDLSYRLLRSNFTISRYPVRIARYKMLSHPDADKLNDRFSTLKIADQRIHIDGLNNLKFTLETIAKKPLFTHIRVTINESEVMADFPELKPKKDEVPPPLTLDNAAAEIEHVSRLIHQRLHRQYRPREDLHWKYPQSQVQPYRPVHHEPGIAHSIPHRKHTMRHRRNIE